MDTKQVWLVTGASKGLGLALVKHLLASGYRVAATSRHAADLVEAAGTHDALLALEVDLTSEEAVQAAIAQTMAHFGQLDAVVNNAGYGQLGALEEVSQQQIHTAFAVNVFSTLNVIRQVLPQLRRQRTGHIFTISSLSGWMGHSGASIYNGTKFAVEGITDALAQELKPLGIKVTAVAPGTFRTGFLSASSASYANANLPDYAHVHAHQQWLKQEQDGKQLGDPTKAAAAIIRLFETENPPTHVLLGSDALQLIGAHLRQVQQEIEDWRLLSESTDYQQASEQPSGKQATP